MIVINLCVYFSKKDMDVEDRVAAGITSGAPEAAQLGRIAGVVGGAGAAEAIQAPGAAGVAGAVGRVKVAQSILIYIDKYVYIHI